MGRAHGGGHRREGTCPWATAAASWLATSDSADIPIEVIERIWERERCGMGGGGWNESQCLRLVVREGQPNSHLVQREVLGAGFLLECNGSMLYDTFRAGVEQTRRTAEGLARITEVSTAARCSGGLVDRSMMSATWLQGTMTTTV